MARPISQARAKVFFTGVRACDDATRRPQHQMQGEFLFVALSCRRQSCEKFEATGCVTDGFAVGVSLQCKPTGAEPVGNRLLGQSSCGVVVCEQFGMGGDDVGETGAQRVRDSPMVCVANRLEK